MRGISKYVVAAIAGSCLVASPGAAIEPDAPEEIISRLDVVSQEIKHELSLKFRRKKTQKKRAQGALVEFYTDRSFAPLWVTETGLNGRAREVIAELKNAALYGLDPRDFRLPPDETIRLKGAFDGGLVLEKTDVLKPSVEWLSKSELQLSYAVLKYAKQAAAGRVKPGSLSYYLDYKNRKDLPDNAKVIEGASKAEDVAAFLRSYHPSNPQFKFLQKRLAELIAEEGQEQGVKLQSVRIPRGKLIRPGDRHDQVVLVRQRLGIKVPVVNGVPEFVPELYDEKLVEAVLAFQKDKNMKTDGIIGWNTRRALSRPIQNRKWQILANMERWRWLPDQLGKTHIQVNIPEFQFRIVSNGTVIHQERVIVGKSSKKTPVFSDEMETVVFNPYWNVPQSIIWDEMGGRTPNGWESRVSRNGLLSIRQPPGPNNALGKVKFLFPNKHSVYMHDTPTKNLFNKYSRTFSHGCVRVRNPRRMAEIVLKLSMGWDVGKVDSYWRSSRNRAVKLKRKIPVHLTYFTVTADKDGKLKFFNDVYGHDMRVTKALRREQVAFDAHATSRSREDRRRVMPQRVTDQSLDSGPSLLEQFFGIGG